MEVYPVQLLMLSDQDKALTDRLIKACAVEDPNQSLILVQEIISQTTEDNRVRVLNYGDGSCGTPDDDLGNHEQKMAELLPQYSSEIDADSAHGYGYTALMIASHMGHVDTVKALLDAGVRPDVVNIYGYSALTCAAEVGNMGVVESILDKSPKSVEVAGATDNTPLTAAMEGGHSEVVDFLLARGADVNRKAQYGDLPIHIATESDDVAMMEKVICAGANIGAKNDERKTSLMLAIEDENVATAVPLLLCAARREDFDGIEDLLSANFPISADFLNDRRIKDARAILEYPASTDSESVAVLREMRKALMEDAEKEGDKNIKREKATKANFLIGRAVLDEELFKSASAAPKKGESDDIKQIRELRKKLESEGKIRKPKMPKRLAPISVVGVTKDVVERPKTSASLRTSQAPATKGLSRGPSKNRESSPAKGLSRRPSKTRESLKSVRETRVLSESPSKSLKIRDKGTLKLDSLGVNRSSSAPTLGGR